MKRRQPETVLQVERQELCHDLRRGRISEHGKHGADEAGQPKEREVEHRPSLVGLSRQKPDECSEAAGKAASAEVDSQPCAWPWINPQVRPNMETAKRMMPAG